jgi:MFS family permease
MLAVSLGQFLIQLDLTIVNVALPAIGRDLGTSVSGLQWVVDGYNLALASLLLVAGRFGDLGQFPRDRPGARRRSRRRVRLAGGLPRRSDCWPRAPSKAASTGSPPHCRSGPAAPARPSPMACTTR